MKRKNLCGRKAVAFLVVTAVFTAVLLTPVSAFAAEKEEQETIDFEELFSNIEEKVSGALSDMDQETVEDVFDFLKEKVEDGSLESGEGIASVIEEGENRFGININPEDAQQIVDVMEKLEELGFSGEEIIEKAEGLYKTYGADFVAHANEAFAEAVEEAVTSAVKGFFKNLWEGVQSSVQNFLKKFE